MLRLNTAGDQITALLAAGTTQPRRSGQARQPPSSQPTAVTPRSRPAGGNNCPPCPQATAALAPGTDSQTDAFAVHQATLSVLQLTSPAASWLHGYNDHRGHTALSSHPPASRVSSLSGQYS